MRARAAWAALIGFVAVLVVLHQGAAIGFASAVDQSVRGSAILFEYVSVRDFAIDIDGSCRSAQEGDVLLFYRRFLGHEEGYVCARMNDRGAF